ncbi:MAG: DUF2490 domain-containing protein [Bacteroidia bacterium]|nr:DUF2490 domain-containing protein [Bacteroidia bacterium]
MTKVYLILFIVFSLVNFTYAQPTQDVGAWFTFNIDYEFKPKLTLLVTQELRLRENISALNLTYNDVGIQYTPIKSIKTSIVYRGIQKYSWENPVSFRHRIMWDVVLKHKFNNIVLQYRSRLQAEVKNYYTSIIGKNIEYFWRNKLALKYELNKRITPYLALEVRTQLHDPRNQFYDSETHRLRYQLGMDYKISQKKTIGIYYLIQDEFNLPNTQDQYIVGLEYSITIK